MSLPPSGIYLLRYSVVPSNPLVCGMFATADDDGQPLVIASRTKRFHAKQDWIVKILSTEDKTCKIYTGEVKTQDSVPGWSYSSEAPHTAITLDTPSTFVLECTKDDPNVCFIRIPGDWVSSGTDLMVGISDIGELEIKPFARGDIPDGRPAWEFELLVLSEE